MPAEIVKVGLALHLADRTLQTNAESRPQRTRSLGRAAGCELLGVRSAAGEEWVVRHKALGPVPQPSPGARSPGGA